MYNADLGLLNSSLVLITRQPCYK